MTISDIKFRRSLTDGTLKAIASLTIDGFIAIHEIKVIETDHLFVAMPKDILRWKAPRNSFDYS